MSVRFLCNAVLKDLRRHRRDPLALMLWAGIPLVTGSMIMLATGGSEGPKPKARLLVVDEDDGFISKLLLGGLGEQGASQIVHAEEVDREQGQARIESGKGSGLLVIPEGFGDAVLSAVPHTLALFAGALLTGWVAARRFRFQ